MIEAAMLDELKAKHGEIVEMKAGGFSVYVKAPTRAIWRKFKTFTADPVKRIDAFESLFKDCVVHPDAPAVEEMLTKKPALAEMFGMEVAALAGSAEEVEKNVC